MADRESGHRADLHVRRRVDARALEQLLQAVDRPGRRADAQAFDAAQILPTGVQVFSYNQKPIHVLREGT